MKCTQTIALVLLSVCSFNSSVLADTWYVDQSSPQDSPGTNWATAFHTIQGGIDAAASNDTVVVTNGTYQPETELLITNAVTVMSIGGSEETFISGNGSNRVMFLSGGAIVDGFSITNGLSTDGGGGVKIYQDASLQNSTIAYNRDELYGGGGVYCLEGGTVINCIITRNSTSGYLGGGIYCDQGGTVFQCSIDGNSARNGAGIFCGSGSMVISSTIANNTATESGGGAYTQPESILRNCILRMNTAQHGGGAFCADGGEFDHCNLIENSASFSTNSGGGIYCTTEEGILNNCIVWSNIAGGNYGGATANWTNNCTSPLIGENCISDDPLFFSTNDFHLMQASPCIDAGISIPGVHFDFDGTPRPLDGDFNGTALPDIGAYELYNPVDNRIYTTHTGGSDNMLDGTTPTNPVTLVTALLIANNFSARNHIVLEAGTYNNLPQLLITRNNVIIDGGYEYISGFWRKCYRQTLLNIDPQEEIEGPAVHKRGVVAAGRHNIMLQDLQIYVSGPSGYTFEHAGKSVYGIYLNDCSYYTVRRVQVRTGNATRGVPGRSGATGSPGNPGSAGGRGNNDYGVSNGGNGGYGALAGPETSYWQDGTPAPSNAWGKVGQTGGCGGEGCRDSSGNYSWHGNAGGGSRTDDRAGGNGSSYSGYGSGGSPGYGHRGEQAGPGGPGGNGEEARSGYSGSMGEYSYLNGYFVPGSGGAGTGGSGGEGGGGGGGAGWHDEGLFGGNDEAGGGGGGGGSGGSGGSGGQGGGGGGSAFSIFIWKRSYGGIIEDCHLLPGYRGSWGSGGAGGAGGLGGAGGRGGAKADNGYAGGNGGNGGQGGFGGRGGNGVYGVRYAVCRQGGAYRPSLRGTMQGCVVNASSSHGYVPPLAAVPIHVQAEDGTSSNYVQISWESVVNAHRYQVFRSTIEAPETATMVAELSGTVYDDPETVPGSTYYYWIKSVLSSRASDFGEADAGYRTLINPVPIELQASELGHAVIWNAQLGITYTLERSTNLVAGTWETIHSETSASNQIFQYETTNLLDNAFYRLND